MNLPLLKDAKNITGKRVLLRLDLNVPILGTGVAEEHSRLEGILPTLAYLEKEGAKEIVILSHHSERGQSLKPISAVFKKKVPHHFIADVLSDEEFAHAREGGARVFLCENLRLWEGEKKNDREFAERLAARGDFYVNEAFSVSHRAHASIVGLPALLPSYAGLLFEQEVRELSRTWKPERPFLFVLGGAKPETKIPLIEKFLPLADNIFLGGVVANIFFKELGWEIGESVGDGASLRIRKILDSGKILLPKDVMVKNNEGVFVKNLADVSAEDAILDVGPETSAMLAELAKKARFILWNGPLGDYLKPGFEKASVAFAKAVSESPAFSIVGGGDTEVLIEKEKLSDSFGFVSSGGGAMLEFLAQGTLPGIEALKAQNHAD